MWANVLMIAFSATLLLYWYRYACQLILKARSTRDYAAAVARANALRFPEMQRRLTAPTSNNVSHLDGIHRALERDFRLLTWLMRHGAEFHAAGSRVEHWMLMLDYRIMGIWYGLLRRISLRRGKDALQEMIHIVNYFAGIMGECTASAQEAA